MTLLTGRTPSKYLRFVLEDVDGVLRELPINKIGNIGLTYPEVDLTALQDALKGFLTGTPGFALTISGPQDNAPAAAISGSGVKPALSGGHDVLRRLVGSLTPRAFAIAIGQRGYWQSGDPVISIASQTFSLTALASDGCLVSGYDAIQNGEAIEYTAKIAMSSGSAAPTFGVTLPGGATEAWFLMSGGTAGAKVVWVSIVGSTYAWHTVSIPTSSTISEIKITRNGLGLYVKGTNGANSNRKTIWQCDNVATIRATPATAPSWTAILAVAQSVTIGGSSYTILDIEKIETDDTSLYTDISEAALSYHYYSVYGGSSWSFSIIGGRFVGFSSVHRGVGIRIPAGNNNNFVASPTLTPFGTTWTNTGGSNPEFWSRYNSTSDLWVAFNDVSTTHLFLRHANSNADFDTTDHVDRMTIRFGGAYGSAYCYAHDEAGKLWIASASGAAFTLFETFDTGAGGRVIDSWLQGGGALIRAQKTTAAGSAAVFINPTRVAGAWIAMTGDLETVYPRTGNLTITDFGLVFA